jgi:hypothetical protein
MVQTRPNWLSAILVAQAPGHREVAADGLRCIGPSTRVWCAASTTTAKVFEFITDELAHVLCGGGALLTLVRTVMESHRSRLGITAWNAPELIVAQGAMATASWCLMLYAVIPADSMSAGRRCFQALRQAGSSGSNGIPAATVLAA